MTVEFTGLGQQKELLRQDILQRMEKVVAHGRFIMGPEVKELEAELANFCGARNAIGVANGTDALQIALMYADVGPGDCVLVPSFTYTATAEVILLLGARPLFVEVDPITFNIDCKDLELRIQNHDAEAGTLKAIISVDLFGNPAESTTLNEISSRHNLLLISDAAQSFGARTPNGAVGTLAPITTTSFFPAKPLGCYGDGGAIFTDDDEIADKIRSIRVHGQGTEKYQTVRVGVNSRLDTLQAAILLSKLTVFAKEIEQRNALAAAYNARLGNLVETPVIEQGVVSAWAQYTIKTNDRDRLKAKLSEAGIPTAVYYPLPMHLQPAYIAYGDGQGSLETSERLSQQVLSLPMNPYWQEDDLDKVCEAVTAALEAV